VVIWFQTRKEKEKRRHAWAGKMEKRQGSGQTNTSLASSVFSFEKTVFLNLSRVIFHQHRMP